MFYPDEESLLSISQLLTRSISELKVDSISATFFPKAIKAESSAYNNKSFHLTADAISLTYNRDNREPSIERCGTPQVTPLSDNKQKVYLSLGCFYVSIFYVDSCCELFAL